MPRWCAMAPTYGTPAVSDVALFKGAQIKAESIESILVGGIAFATPDYGSNLPLAQAGEAYRLNDNAKPEWLAWKPRIELAQ